MNKGKENKNAEISARMAKILQYTGDTRNSFAVKLGYERAQTVYDIMNMKSAPSFDFFNRFSISEYSDIIDIRWLLSGEGSMLREDQLQSSPNLVVQPVTLQDSSSGEAAAYYRMYKEEKEQKETLLKENGRLEERLRQLEASQGKPHEQHQSDEIALAFPSDSLEGCTKESLLMRKPTTSSERSSAGKM